METLAANHTPTRHTSKFNYLEHHPSNSNNPNNKCNFKQTLVEYARWLESVAPQGLTDQNRWKPSDKQRKSKDSWTCYLTNKTAVKFYLT